MALTDPQARRYTYKDLAAFPDDRLRREIIGGELVVTPSPAVRHQRASSNIHHHLYRHAAEHGGLVLAAPIDLVLSDEDVIQPDLLFVRAEHMERVLADYIDGPPDVVVEISSPSTRRLELVRKRELYERYAVPEYWFVDLDADRVEVYVHRDGVYGAPQMLFPGQEVRSAVLGGFTMPVDAALAL